MSELERDRTELEPIRSSLLEAGLGWDEEKLESLLPRYRLQRESGARIAHLPLEGVDPQVVFDARWLS